MQKKIVWIDDTILYLPQNYSMTETKATPFYQQLTLLVSDPYYTLAWLPQLYLFDEIIIETNMFSVLYI